MAKHGKKSMADEFASTKPVSTGSVKRKFLVIVDSTPEAAAALEFAARRAARTGGGLTLLYVLSPTEFQHWIGVENIMKEEAQTEAEKVLSGLIAKVGDDVGIKPEIVIREGKTNEQLLTLIREDPDIAVLVLGAASGKEGPGPLVSMVANEVAGSFPIPVTIVPGSLSSEQIQALT